VSGGAYRVELSALFEHESGRAQLPSNFSARAHGSAAIVGRPTMKIVAGVAARVDVDVDHLIAAAGRTHRGQLSSLVELDVELP
jgi:hypothetical protein